MGGVSSRWAAGFHEARTSAPEHAHAALAWIGRLYDVEREARVEAGRRALEQGGTETTHRTLEEELLSTWRRDRSRPIWEAFFIWLDTMAGAVLPKSPLGEAVSYARSNRTALGRYLEAPYPAIDNNATERALRPIALGRNNWLHLGSDAGGRTAAVLLSVVQSCHALRVEPWAYLRDVLERVSTHPASRVAELLPDAWARGLDGSRSIASRRALEDGEIARCPSFSWTSVQQIPAI